MVKSFRYQASGAVVLLLLAAVLGYFWRSAQNTPLLQCNAEQQFYSTLQQAPYRQLTVSLAMMRDHRGYFDIYGYSQRDSDTSAAKLSRRLYFSWQSVGNNYLLTMTHQDLYNRDNASNDMLPEFLGSKTLVIYIRKLTSGRFLIGDLASPFGVCSGS